MTVQELKDILEDYPEYWEIKIRCPQVHGAKVLQEPDLWCDGDDLFLTFELDKDVTCCGY